MHGIAALAIDQLKATPKGHVLDDRGVDVLVAAFEKAFHAGEAFAAAGALMATATVWLGTEGTGAAARTLLAFVLALHPVLARLDEKAAAALKTDAEAAAAKFSAFSGDVGHVADKVLDAAAPRPAGTTRASPLARFALLSQAVGKTSTDPKQEP